MGTAVLLDLFSGKAERFVEGNWDSRPFPVKPFRYYSLTYAADAPSPAYFAAIFQGADGTELASDHYDGIEPTNGFRTDVRFFRARADAATATIRFRPMEKPFSVRDVRVAEAGAGEIAAAEDALAASLPPVRYRPEWADCRWLPTVRARLAEGGRLRVVMLGDSIVNDVGNSVFDILLMRRFPKTTVEVQTSVRGSTSCAWYKEENRIESYVMQYAPDFVVLCARSNRGCVEAIGDVVRQLRARGVSDILIATDPFGGDGDPRGTAFVPPPQEPPRYRGAEFRALAEREKTAFIDLQFHWEEFVSASNRPYADFMRDLHHANFRGRTAIAPVLLAFFDQLVGS